MSNLKNLSIYILVIAVGIALAAFIIPAMIKGFFLALGWMISNPALGLVISITFLLGCFVGNLKVAK